MNKHGRANITPNAPQAVAICDRCGFLYNHSDLSFQFIWAGTGMVQTRTLVCAMCLDIPNEQLRAIILPPDPPPVFDTRPEPFEIDERKDYEVRADLLVTSILLVDLTLVHTTDKQISAGILGVSSMVADLTIPASLRITEAGDTRITEAGDTRIIE